MKRLMITSALLLALAAGCAPLQSQFALGRTRDIKEQGREHSYPYPTSFVLEVRKFPATCEGALRTKFCEPWVTAYLAELLQGEHTARDGGEQPGDCAYCDNTANAGRAACDVAYTKAVNDCIIDCSGDHVCVLLCQAAARGLWWACMVRWDLWQNDCRTAAGCPVAVWGVE